MFGPRVWVCAPIGAPSALRIRIAARMRLRRPAIVIGNRIRPPFDVALPRVYLCASRFLNHERRGTSRKVPSHRFALPDENDPGEIWTGCLFFFSGLLEIGYFNDLELNRDFGGLLVIDWSTRQLAFARWSGISILIRIATGIEGCPRLIEDPRYFAFEW